MKKIEDTYICTTSKDIKKLIKYCKQTGYSSFDFETTTAEDQGGFHDEGGFITVLGVSFQQGSRWVIPLGHYDSPFRSNWKKILRKFAKEVLEDINIVKIAWNVKYEMKWLMKYKLTIKGTILDGMLMKYLLDEEKPMGLKPNVARFIPQYANYDNEVGGLVKKYGWDKVPLEPLCKYCGFDTDMTMRLTLFFENRLIEDGRLYNVYRNLLMPATFVLAEAEFKGMSIDTKVLEKNINKFSKIIDDLSYKLANHRKVKKYEKWKIKNAKRKLILSVEEEVEELENELKSKKVKSDPKKVNSINRKIKNREDKIAKYVAGNFTTKKELTALEPINFASPKQLVELLFTSPKGFRFDVIKYTYDKKKRRESDTPSTDADTLLALYKKYDNSFLTILMELKNYEKIYTSFLIGLKDKLSDHATVHPSFLLHGTVTNRLSAVGPNLQQIPRNYDPDSPNAVVKNMFNCPKGMVMIHMDYSAAELRVLAGIANEETMIKWFKEGRDFHLASACKKYKVDYDEILAIYSDENHKDYSTWNVRRKQAKTINFGILYGQGPDKLAESLSDKKAGIQVTKNEAIKFIDDFHRDFPKVSKWIKKQEDLLEKQGYVRMPFGTKRRLPSVWNSNFGDVSRAKRQAVNSPIQGTASNMTLFTSVMIREARLRGELPKTLIEVATVHDSIIFYAFPKDIHKLVPKLLSFGRVDNLQDYFGFRWPGDKIEMKMDIEIGKTWGSLHNYNKKENYLKWAS